MLRNAPLSVAKSCLLFTFTFTFLISIFFVLEKYINSLVCLIAVEVTEL